MLNDATVDAILSSCALICSTLAASSRVAAACASYVIQPLILPSTNEEFHTQFSLMHRNFSQPTFACASMSFALLSFSSALRIFVSFCTR